jgi:hypothetical protein
VEDIEHVVVEVEVGINYYIEFMDIIEIILMDMSFVKKR